MLNLKKLLESVEACLGWPYVSPGNNNASGIDCSGLFVKAYQDQGASIYHGSNSIYRKYCSEKGELKDVSQLVPGMAVFKWNANTPEKFNDGLGDFQHIGLVTGVNPLRIVHASSAVGCVTTDTKLGKWKYWGKLKDVDYGASATLESPSTEDEGEIVVPVAETVIGYITADKVNFRTGPSTSKPRIEYLSTGDQVEVIGEKGDWLKCKALGRVGYVKAGFVSTESLAPSQPLPAEDYQDDRSDQPQDSWPDEDKTVWIEAPNGGRVNIRSGNGLNYGRITSVQSKTALPYVATAANGWYAVKVKNCVGWVSPEFGVLGVG